MVTPLVGGTIGAKMKRERTCCVRTPRPSQRVFFTRWPRIISGMDSSHQRISIDRVFRNETLDHTHLAEFHQVEFFCADRGLGLGHLIGMIREFFARFGVKNLKFKPAYNPYTEPSMEIFGWHPLLKKTVELGN